MCEEHRSANNVCPRGKVVSGAILIACGVWAFPGFLFGWMAPQRGEAYRLSFLSPLGFVDNAVRAAAAREDVESGNPTVYEFLAGLLGFTGDVLYIPLFGYQDVLGI